MKKLFNYKFWLYYSSILATLLSIVGFYISGSSINIVIANILFLPVVVFLWLCFWKYLKFAKLGNSSGQTSGGLGGNGSGFWLLLYSVFFTTVITVGGYVNSRSNAEIISNTIFLPITIFCWYTYYTRPKRVKSLVGRTTNAFLRAMAETAKKRGLEGAGYETAEKTAGFNEEKVKPGIWDTDDFANRQANPKPGRDF